MKKVIVIVLLCEAMFLGITGCSTNKNEFEVGDKSDIVIKNDDVLLSIKKETLTNKGATLILKNNGTMDFEYGEPYEIEIKKNGDWHKINVELNFILPIYILKKGETKEINLNWENGYGKLSPGTYRIIKSINYKNDKNNDQLFNIAAEFMIES